MFSLAFFGQSEADKYLAGMTDTDPTLRTDLRTLINALVAAGVWSKLRYLGVIQNLQADTQRCLKRRTSSFSWGSMSYLANNGLTAATTVGYISSGFSPVVMSDNSFTFGTTITVAPPTGSSTGHHFGRWDLASSVDNYIAGYYQYGGGFGSNWGNNGSYLRFITNPHTIGASLANGTTLFGGRQDSNTVFSGAGATTTSRTSLGSAARLGSFSVWTGVPDDSVYHGNWNNGSGPSASANTATEIGAWFGADYLSAAETDALATAINTYLTARGAI